MIRFSVWLVSGYAHVFLTSMFVPLLAVIWSYPGQDYNSATRHLCGWSGRLKQSTTGHSFRTYTSSFQKHAQGASFLTFLLQD